MKIDEAYGYIKRQIIEGTWEPEAAINVNDITSNLKMSRTPVHKALTKLEQEGFLSIIPQVGVFVKMPEQHEVHERLILCATLDALMTEQAAIHLNEAEFTYMEDTLIRMDDPHISQEEYSSLNIEFHRTIYEASKLSYTYHLAKQLWDYLNYVGNANELFSKERRKHSQIEHWMIHSSLKENDRKLARELMENHMRRVANLVSINYQNINKDQNIYS